MEIVQIIFTAFLIGFVAMGITTLNQLRTYLFVLQQIKEKELKLVHEQVVTTKEETQASLPMDALNTNGLEQYLQQTQTLNLDDYEIVTPRRSF